MSATTPPTPPPWPEGGGAVVRWQIEQVLALAPRPSSVSSAQTLAVPARWVGTGCDSRAVWGRCTGGSAEPYECTVDHVGVAFGCTCASRLVPCKHALALLMMWVVGQVPEAEVPRSVARRLAGWAAGRPAGRQDGDSAGREGGDSSPAASPAASPSPSGSSDGAPQSAPWREPGGGRDDRSALMAGGLAELDRWLEDRLRTGLADPVLSHYATWDGVAARLVDAKAGAMANRVRRSAGFVGAHPQWQEQVLAEIGMLHLLAVAGRRPSALPPELADSVATAVGWQVRQADVLAGVPNTDRWVVMGRSDTREDRIEVRRVWLRGEMSGRWAMVLSFAAYQQRFDEPLPVGAGLTADLFRYPGLLGLRAVIGRRHDEPSAAGPVGACTPARACDEIGGAVAAEPWLERYPVCVEATPARAGARWVLTDHTGSLPLADRSPGVATLVACSEGRSLPITAEWTPLGLVPLTVHLPDRVVDVGPSADPSFVSAA